MVVVLLVGSMYVPDALLDFLESLPVEAYRIVVFVFCRRNCKVDTRLVDTRLVKINDTTPEADVLVVSCWDKHIP